MPTGPAAREGDDVGGGGTGNRQRKQRVHTRKRGDWRLFYRHSLCTLHRFTTLAHAHNRTRAIDTTRGAPG